MIRNTFYNDYPNTVNTIFHICHYIYPNTFFKSGWLLLLETKIISCHEQFMQILYRKYHITHDFASIV